MEPTIERRYEKGYELLPTEEAEALRIAKAHGITDIQAIHCYPILPTSQRSIGVVEREVIKDQHVTYRFIGLTDLGNARDPNRALHPSFQFDKIDTATLMILKIQGQEHRVRVTGVNAVPIEQAKVVANAFATGSFQIAAPHKLDELKNAELTNPATIRLGGLSREPGTISISFGRKGTRSEEFHVECTIKEGHVIVKDIIHIII